MSTRSLEPESSRLRWSGRTTSVVWGTVVAALIAVTLPALWWHVEFFRHAGESYQRLLWVVLPLLFTAPFVYHRLRTERVRRAEPYVLLLLALGPVAVREPVALLVAGLLALSCHEIGRWILGGVDLEPSPGMGSVAVRLAAGLGALTLVWFAASSAMLLRPATAAILLFPSLLSLWRLRSFVRRWGEPGAVWVETGGSSSVTATLAVFYSAVFVTIASLSVVTPAIDGDAVRFHLSLTQTYLNAGGLVLPKYADYGFYPQSFEMLSAMLWSLGGQAAAQLLNPVLFGITLLLVRAIGRELGFSGLASALGALLGATLPFLHWTGSVVKNDMAVAMYLLAAWLSLRWGRSQGRFAWVYLAVFLAGCGLAVKHTALLGVVPIGWLVAGAWWREPGRAKRAVVLAALLLLPVSGWYLRAWRATGNPVFPDKISQAASRDVYRPTFWSKVVRYVDIPWRMHFHGRSRFESPTENPAGFSLLALAPLLLLVRFRGNPAARRMVWVFAGVYLLYWNHVIGMIRFAIVPLLVLCLFLADSLLAVAFGPSRVLRGIAHTALTYCFVFATLVTVILEMYPSQPGLLRGAIDKQEFLRRELMPYGVVRALEGRAGPGDRVYSVGAWAIGYAPFPGQINLVYRTTRIYTVEDLQELSRDRFAFLILPVADNLAELERAAAALHTVRSVYADKHFRLYRLE